MKRTVRRWVGMCNIRPSFQLGWPEKSIDHQVAIDITFEDGEPEPQGEWMEANPFYRSGNHKMRHRRLYECGVAFPCRPEPQEAKGEVLEGCWMVFRGDPPHRGDALCDTTGCRPVEIRFKKAKKCDHVCDQHKETK